MARRAATVRGAEFVPWILSSTFAPQRAQATPEDVLSKWKRSEERTGWQGADAMRGHRTLPFRTRYPGAHSLNHSLETSLHESAAFPFPKVASPSQG